MSLFDDLPPEVRRLNWGWFGEPWPSGICYDEDGRLIEEMRKPVPVGEKCFCCDEVLAEGDQGKSCGPLPAPFPGAAPAQLAHQHKECGLRQVIGPIAHLERRCHCHGGEGNDTPGLTRRQDALAVWAWVQEHGLTPT
jgi:hypothetical protein